nr:UBN2 domain-containing protein [Tanacetum cinerariifolium]
MKDLETKITNDKPYELLKDDEKKQLDKNNEAKMTLYNDLPYKDLKSLDLDYSSKNHVRMFLRALLSKWRAKVTVIEEAKDLATLPLDELIRNLKVYEMVLDNDGVASKTTKEKVKSLVLFAKITREQTSNDSDYQGGSNEDVEEEEEAKAFNLLARKLRKFFHKARMEKVTDDKYKGKLKTLDLSKNEFNWFKCDTPLEKGFDEFYRCWWMKREKEDLSDGGRINYVPNDEWKRLELEKNNLNQANQECIGEYGPMIDDNDFEYMCDYLLSKDAPFTMNNEEGRLEEKRYKLLRTPNE